MREAASSQLQVCEVLETSHSVAGKQQRSSNMKLGQAEQVTANREQVKITREWDS